MRKKSGFLFLVLAAACILTACGRIGVAGTPGAGAAAPAAEPRREALEMPEGSVLQFGHTGAGGWTGCSDDRKGNHFPFPCRVQMI